MRKVTYVGMDVHLNQIVAVWKRVDSREFYAAVANSESGWEELRRRVGCSDVVAVYEASGTGFGLRDWLTQRGWKVWVVAPTHLPKSPRGRKTKTDLRDARQLMELAMSHGELGTTLPTVWIPGEKIRADREIVRRRLKLAEHVTQVKNGITGLLRVHGKKRPEELKTLWTQKHVRWLKTFSESSELAPAIRKALASLIRELEFLQDEVERLNEDVAALAKEEDYRRPVAKMTELPGVATLTAMTYLLELGDVRRFQNRRQVASYLGLVPSCYESGEASDRKGHITRMGPSRIRKVLNQAALAFIREDERWRSWYQALAKRRGTKKAIVATMRRLGIELWQRARSA